MLIEQRPSKALLLTSTDRTEPEGPASSALARIEILAFAALLESGLTANAGSGKIFTSLHPPRPELPSRATEQLRPDVAVYSDCMRQSVAAQFVH